MSEVESRQYLKKAHRLNEQIRDKRERIDHLKGLLMSIGATDYSKDRVQTSQNNEASFANIIANLDETEQQLNDDVLKLCILQREISQAIDAVDDVDCSLVLSKRYLLMKDWEQIADEMGYGIRQIFRIHKKALNIFEVPENMSHHVI